MPHRFLFVIKARETWYRGGGYAIVLGLGSQTIKKNVWDKICRHNIDNILASLGNQSGPFTLPYRHTWAKTMHSTTTGWLVSREIMQKLL